ncbi:MAG: DciA family protein [Candidatus Peribacteraceae bacterium]|nr:DciA family protein [Candidatus Peribacteraceae bacterium]
MDRAFSILPKVLNHRGLADAAYSGLILQRASAWIREQLPDYAASLHPSQLKDGVLMIEGSHSIAVAECSQHCQDLLAHLASAVPEAPVRSVRVVRAR